jgi:hypothetical protein
MCSPLIAFFRLAAVWLLLAACAGVSPAAAGPLEIRAGSKPVFPHYACTDEDGQTAGLSVGLINAVAHLTGLDLGIPTGPCRGRTCSE